MTERIRPLSVTEIACPECCVPAQRQAIYPISQGNLTTVPMGQRPLKIGAYQEAAAEIEYDLEKRNSHLEHPEPTPNYYGVAKDKARARIAAGEAD